MSFLRFATISGALAVCFGAFGAHYLRPLVGANNLHAYLVGVEYQFIHTLALLAVSLLTDRFSQNQKVLKRLKFAGGFFMGGIVLFSGSLYLIATEGTLWSGPKVFLGPITPLGGLLFILAWVFMFFAAKKIN